MCFGAPCQEHGYASPGGRGSACGWGVGRTNNLQWRRFHYDIIVSIISITAWHHHVSGVDEPSHCSQPPKHPAGQSVSWIHRILLKIERPLLSDMSYESPAIHLVVVVIGEQNPADPGHCIVSNDLPTGQHRGPPLYLSPDGNASKRRRCRHEPAIWKQWSFPEQGIFANIKTVLPSEFDARNLGCAH